MRFLLFFILLAGILLPSNAQIKSGSFRIDGDLNNINVSASADFGRFRSELSTGYNIKEDRINYYHAELGMQPADIYFALELSRVSRRPFDEVIRVYRVSHAKGWGEIAKELGIKPGSTEFHALKNNANKKSGKYKQTSGHKGKDNKPKGGKGNGNGKNKKN